MDPENTEAAENESEDPSQENEDEVTDENSSDGTANEEQSNEEENAEDDDPIESWKKEFETTREAQIRQELEEKVRKDIQEQYQSSSKAQQDAAARERLRGSFANTAQITANMLKQLDVYDQDGEKLTFDDAAIQAFIQPWQTHNSVVQQAEEAKVYENLAQTIFNSLPKSAQESFAERAANKPLQEYVKTFAEHYATESEAYKSLKMEMEEKIKAAEAKGFAKAQKAPKGTAAPPPAKGAPAQQEAYDTSTLVGLARARAAGHVSEAEFNQKYREIRNRF